MAPQKSNEPTAKQLSVLKFIKKHIVKKSLPPTVREIAGHFGFASPLSAQLHIAALIKKGYLKKTPFKQRALEVVGHKPAEDTKIPLLGRVRAGEPILASENIEDYINIDRNIFKVKDGFALKVIGNSMINAGIFEGDIVLIAPDAEVVNKDIVVALIGEEATIKRFFLKKNTVRLVPENNDMKPITLKGGEVTIIGKVAGVMRKLP
jgi:repressor LexA